MVQDPVMFQFDADGRLWVVEMRGFMPDIDGKTEKEPTGRISILEDDDGDGKMDRSTIYLDSLILPRSLALVNGGALVADYKNLWLTKDTDGDLQADSKMIIDSAYANGPSPEHSANGLLLNTDNWYYNARSTWRYKFLHGQWVRDLTEFRGQWGISHDDAGRLYYNYNWSQLHADLVPPNYFSGNSHHQPTTGIDHGLTTDRRVYPVRANPAVNRGYVEGTLDKEGRLIEFTSACAPFNYRGTALPAAYYGNLFVCEPSGNLIKRNIVEKNGLMLSAKDPNPGKEFLASTDERFRPVYLASGPDGALYIADMYHGLIQHGSYVTPYLRNQTLERKLDQPVHYGRIWKIVPVNGGQAKPKKLSVLTTAELVDLLSDPDGWYRDMAQRLLVEQRDTAALQPLTDLIRNSKNQSARVHAVWILEGLEKSDPQLLFTLLEDSDTLIRSTAIRLLEPMAEKDEKLRSALGKALTELAKKAPEELILQITLTARILDPDISQTLLAGIADRYDSSALIRDAVLSSLQDQEWTFLQRLWKTDSWYKQVPGKEIFLEMLTTAIIRKGEATELSELLNMLDQNRNSGWKYKPVLNAIAIYGKNKISNPVVLRSIPGIIVRKEVKTDQAIYSSFRNLFRWPGHETADSSTNSGQVALTGNDQVLFIAGRQQYLTSCSGCHGADGRGMKRFAPPLVNSDWVTGDQKRLTLLVLHGMEGPLEVNGKVYDEPEILPVMPAHSTLDDGALAAVLTYIRNEWGNAAGPVSGKLISKTRHLSQGQVKPWKADELNLHIQRTKQAEEK